MYLFYLCSFPSPLYNLLLVLLLLESYNYKYSRFGFELIRKMCTLKQGYDLSDTGIGTLRTRL